MKQLNYLAIALLLLLSEDIFVFGQTTDPTATTATSSGFAIDWINDALKTMIQNTNAGNGTSAANTSPPDDTATPDDGPVWSTSQGMYMVVRPDGTSQTGSYITDENGVTTTEVHENK